MADYFSGADPYLADYQAKAKQASSMSASAITLPDMLKQAINEKLGNSAVTQERTNAATGFLSELGRAPDRVTAQNQNGVILSPTQQASLISGYRASALAPLIQANQRYDLINGTLGDVVGQAGRAYQAQAGQANDAAKLSRDMYELNLDRMYKNAQLGLASQKATKPSAQETKSKDTLNTIDNALARLVQAKQQIKSGKVKSGTGAGLESFIQGLIGGGMSPGTSTAQTAISQINQTLFEVAGKAFTKNEQALLPGMVLNVKDDPKVLDRKIDALIQDFARRKSLLQSGSLLPSSYEQTTNNLLDNGGDDEWESVGYIPE